MYCMIMIKCNYIIGFTITHNVRDNFCGFAEQEQKVASTYCNYIVEKHFRKSAKTTKVLLFTVVGLRRLCRHNFGHNGH